MCFLVCFGNTEPPNSQMWFFPVPKQEPFPCQAEMAAWRRTPKGRVTERFIYDRREVEKGIYLL